MTFQDNASALTHIMVVSDIAKSREFYVDILGAEIYREYGGTSLVLSFLDSWLLLVTGGGPTEDKPDVSFATPENPSAVSHSTTIRVTDCRDAYNVLTGQGVEFLTPPVDHGYEVRCFFRDPDGHLLEISEASSD